MSETKTKGGSDLGIISVEYQYNDFVIPLECNANDDWDDKFKSYSDIESDDDDVKPGFVKPKVNEWKGENIALPVLGQFDTEFDKTVKHLVQPERALLNLDPFYRTEYPDSHEPANGEAYVLWKNRSIAHGKCLKPVNPPSNNINSRAVEKGSNILSLDNTSTMTYVEYGSDDEGSSGIVGYNYSCGETVLSESDTEIEINELMEDIKVKREMGVSLTGESLWYDESKDMIRNLHKKSYSLTSYVPPDNNLYGKGRIMQSILSPSELKMLVSAENSNCPDDTMS